MFNISLFILGCSPREDKRCFPCSASQDQPTAAWSCLYPRPDTQRTDDIPAGGKKKAGAEDQGGEDTRGKEKGGDHGARKIKN